MAVSNISSTVRSGMCDFFVDSLDLGAGDPTGDIAGFTAAFALLLFECAFSNPAFGAAAVGVATAAAIADDVSANNSGTAAVGRLRDRANAATCDFSIGVGSGDLQMNTLAVVAGDRIGVSSAIVTMPAT